MASKCDKENYVNIFDKKECYHKTATMVSRKKIDTAFKAVIVYATKSALYGLLIHNLTVVWLMVQTGFSYINIMYWHISLGWQFKNVGENCMWVFDSTKDEIR